MFKYIYINLYTITKEIVLNIYYIININNNTIYKVYYTNQNKYISILNLYYSSNINI
jgi:hypothetical protein